MDPPFKVQSLGTVLFAALSISLIKQSLVSSLDTKNGPFHLSWKEKQARYDVVFTPNGTLTDVIRLENVSANSSLDKSLVSCKDSSACLFKDGQHIRSYSSKSGSNLTESFVFESSEGKSTSKCFVNDIVVHNYCSTHWNPPTHLTGSECRHTIEWHSPYSCHTNTTNYERPCYIYDSDGRLLDLTPWILSNGSSYDIDTTPHNNTIKKFYLNVCNEAYNSCGPNVSSCYLNSKGTVEGGYNNLTSIKYEGKDQTVLLTSLGEYNQHCPDSRVRTVVRFICKSKVVHHPKPRLIRTTGCESIIEWPTIHACPQSEITVPATKCSIKYEPLGIDINLRQLAKNDTVLVPNLKVNGKQKNILLSLCKGIPLSTVRCGGKSTSSTSACLIDASDDKRSEKTTNSSEIVGSISKSFIRLADDRLYWDSYVVNKSCHYSSGRDFNATKQVGTRVEFFCSQKNDDKPTFLDFRDCTYIFEWGSTSMCLESVGNDTNIPSKVIEKPTSSSSANSTSDQKQQENKLPDKEMKIDHKTESKTAYDMHKDTLEDSKRIIDSTNFSDHSHAKEEGEQLDKHTVTTPPRNDSSEKQNYSPSSPPQKELDGSETPNGGSRMSKLHKFFMISLIVMSLFGFIVIIFILDKKTQLSLPLSNIRRRARQALQPQPVPYTRVDQFNDLDL